MASAPSAAMRAASHCAVARSASVSRAFDDEQAHGTVALQLHDEAAVNLSVDASSARRREQLGQHARSAGG